MEEKKVDRLMRAVATRIVDGRYIIFAVFLIAAICSVITMGKVRINSDIKTFLPKNTETRHGIDVMAEEFLTYGSANIMIEDITYEEAEELTERISGINHVFSAEIKSREESYKENAALISVSFDGEVNDENTERAMEEIKDTLKKYKACISSQVGSDYNKILAKEMSGVILIAAIVIVSVLLFTSRSYFEVVIFFITFIFAGLINMGTNFWLGEISSITNSVAIILQLALAIDYSIIFCHRYQTEVDKAISEREALIEALSKAIIEITSSSLTTISGLFALTLMQFRLGYDLGTVLSKGIICSLLSVFLLMPGVIALFPALLRKTAHRSLVPDIEAWGNFLTRSRYCFVIVFFILLPFAVCFSLKTEYAFSDSSIDEIIYSESRDTEHKIAERFGKSTAVAILVPRGDYDKEQIVLDKVSELSEIKSATGITAIEFGDNYKLTDKYSVDGIVQLLDFDKDQIEKLYKAYRMEKEGLGSIKKDVAGYEIALIDLFQFLMDKVEHGIVTLDGETTNKLFQINEKLSFATNQLCGKNYDRLVFSCTLPSEGKESRDFVEKIKNMVEEEYGEGKALVIGDITSARDLSDSYTGDSIKINLLTICFVFLIIFCTFKTFVGALVLVFVIQGSIWINFSFPYLQSFSTSFVTNMIVSAIQMGATIDYAIVLMNRYLVHKRDKDKKTAMSKAVSESFATIITSGSILTIAGFLIAYRVSDVYVGHIGLAVGRGALISIILVLSVLPQLILLFDGLIQRTTIKSHYSGGRK